MANSQAMVSNKGTGSHLRAHTALHKVNTDRLPVNTALRREQVTVLRPASMALLLPASMVHLLLDNTVHLLQANMVRQEVVIMRLLRHPPLATFPVNRPTSTCLARPMISAPP
jgi:hypothetical protein